MDLRLVGTGAIQNTRVVIQQPIGISEITGQMMSRGSASVAIRPKPPRRRGVGRQAFALFNAEHHVVGTQHAHRCLSWSGAVMCTPRQIAHAFRAGSSLTPDASPATSVYVLRLARNPGALGWVLTSTQLGERCVDTPVAGRFPRSAAAIIFLRWL